MINRDDLPATPEWELPADLHTERGEAPALPMPLGWDGDQA